MRHKTKLTVGEVVICLILCAPVVCAVLISLKLSHVIHRSWWWVTSPVWGAMCLAAALLLILSFFSIAFVRRRGGYYPK